MSIKLSLYWKCQLIGWGAFALLSFIVNSVINPGASAFLIRAFITAGFGLVFTHVLRALIKRFEIFSKKLALQIIYLLILIVLVCFVATLLFVFLLKTTGILARNQPADAPPERFVETFVLLYYQVLIIVSAWTTIYFLVQYIRGIKKVEREKADLKIQLVELEAQALRAQMNPHFVFNCLNSIKSFINKNENANAAEYLTTFSKLIRTLFQNSDKREVSLHEELETCRLYTQIEKMRFGDKVDFKFDIDPNIDLKDVKVPALILQPFIENAIWHGLIPKESGGTVLVSVKGKNGIIECTIDDEGIGRPLSKAYKAQYESTHKSRGIGLTLSRLELDRVLNNREDIIQIIDKTDAWGNSAGTRVVLSFAENKMS